MHLNILAFGDVDTQENLDESVTPMICVHINQNVHWGIVYAD